MGIFHLNQEELLTFFAVLVRFSVLVSVLPFIGENYVPQKVKVLFGLVLSVALYPILISTGIVNPADALVWGSTTSGIVQTITLEVLFALALAYTARMAFYAFQFGANLTGNFMGYSIATVYDPKQEARTHVIAELQIAIAMLTFLAINGHHMFLKASLMSFQIVGIGKAAFGGLFSAKLVEISGQVFKFAMQISAPVAVSLFAINVAVGVITKAMPQLNFWVLTFAVSTLVGMIVLLLSIPTFQAVVKDIIERMGFWMEDVMVILGQK